MMETSVSLKFFFVFYLYFSVLLGEISTGHATTPPSASTKENPLSARASLIRYWKRHVSNSLPIPAFLFSKASPLSHLDSAFYAKRASENTLSSHLPSFCTSAHLFCLLNNDSDITAHSQSVSNVAQIPHNHKDGTFASYTNKGFSTYSPSGITGTDSFTSYSENLNSAASTFSAYSEKSNSHDESFINYENNAKVATSNFNSYDAHATAGSGRFTNYMPQVNDVRDLRFTSYTSVGNSHPLNFKSYVDDTNSANEAFVSYAQTGTALNSEFSGYGDSSNVAVSSFGRYSELGNAANDIFSAYSSDSKNPTNDFKLYGNGGNAITDSFSSYREQANAGKDSFLSYGRNSNAQKTNFLNYGYSTNQGSDSFREYGLGANAPSTGFRLYAFTPIFKEYSDKGATFSLYARAGDSLNATDQVNKFVEPGKFFREKELKEGNVMKMPDIRDPMPKRSFLPRVISSKLPFSTAKLSQLKHVFNAHNMSTMEHMLAHTLQECERAPSQGETKQCVGSLEDMIDFAASVLGHNLAVRTTEKINGSNQDVMIGKTIGINGGKTTKSVSCHQSLYPYLLYYCHSVPKVRVYVADILDVETKEKINKGVAICHIDTSAWSPGHGAFLALGSGPGKIEVCHWIFENDMTWAAAD